MNDAQRLADYLAHILEAIERIEEYVSNIDEPAFLVLNLRRATPLSQHPTHPQGASA
jgi:uncharacterized protein with HEPN domain